ncbi:hypothetical protein BGW80DRAFT_889764 [Lactifluus volemus]|nr:hypothetical protein BGW80DRAFT_889764 [Lactifluus volemus]
MAETLLAILLVTSFTNGSSLIYRWPPSPHASPCIARPRPTVSSDPEQPVTLSQFQRRRARRPKKMRSFFPQDSSKRSNNGNASGSVHAPCGTAHTSASHSHPLWSRNSIQRRRRERDVRSPPPPPPPLGRHARGRARAAARRVWCTVWLHRRIPRGVVVTKESAVSPKVRPRRRRLLFRRTIPCAPMRTARGRFKNHHHHHHRNSHKDVRRRRERKHRMSSSEDVSSSAEFDSAFENDRRCRTAADTTADFVVLAGDVPRGIRA